MTYRVPGHDVMRPSKNYKKLEYAHVEALLALIEDVREDGLEPEEQNAYNRLQEIRDAMVEARKKKIERESKS